MSENGRQSWGNATRWLIPSGVFFFYLATAGGYGYFRDEFYYLANARHLGWGYVDHPPLIGWATAALTALFGDSLLAIRALPAACAALTTWAAMQLTSRLGGRPFAVGLAGVASFLLPAHLALFSFLSMNAITLLIWALSLVLLVEILDRDWHRGWILFGLLTGVGLLNKIDVLFLGGGLFAALVMTRRFAVFRRWELWLGGAIAVGVFAPHLIWQQLHGWPTLEFMRNARLFKIDGGFGAFLGGQFQMAGPMLLLFATLGVFYLLRQPRATAAALLGWLVLAVVAALAVSGTAKAYYLAPAYTPAIAGGALAFERWSARRRSMRTWRGLLVLVTIVTTAPLAPLAKALLPVTTLVRYAGWIGIIPDSGERHEKGTLPQHFADMHGWPELAQTVARVAAALPPQDQERACVFAQNYGEAGALEHFSRTHAVPPVISGHNSYFLWGPGMCDGSVLLVVGGRADDLRQAFADVEPGGIFRCTSCMPYENDMTIWIARGPTSTLEEAWAKLKHFN